MTSAYNPGSRFRLISAYGKRIDPFTGQPGKFHSGQDIAAPAGTPIPTATTGQVVYSGFNQNLGNVGIVKNDSGDYSLYGHMRGDQQVKLGQRIWPGEIIGLVGSTGERAKGNHLHYSVITNDAGKKIEKSDQPRDRGQIGIELSDQTTKNPARYHDYDPAPYLDQTLSAEQRMFGTDTGTASGMPAAGRPASFDDRFEKWGSRPAVIAPPPTSDLPESFDSRFESWDAVPAGGARSPVLRALEQYRRSAAPEGPASFATNPSHATPLVSGAGLAALPFSASPDFPSDGTQGIAGNNPVHYLGRRNLNQSPEPSSVAGGPAVPFHAAVNPYSPGGLPAWIAAAAGIDLQNPTRFVPMSTRAGAGYFDGDGIMPEIYAASDSDPREPVPPPWPTLPERPIRYLGRRVR